LFSILRRISEVYLQSWASAEIFPGGKRQQFAHHFQVADDAMQMAVNKTVYPFYMAEIMPYVSATATKIALRWRSNASFSLMLFSHCIKLRCLPLLALSV